MSSGDKYSTPKSSKQPIGREEGELSQDEDGPLTRYDRSKEKALDAKRVNDSLSKSKKRNKMVSMKPVYSSDSSDSEESEDGDPESQRFLLPMNGKVIQSIFSFTSDLS